MFDGIKKAKPDVHHVCVTFHDGSSVFLGAADFNFQKMVDQKGEPILIEFQTKGSAHTGESK